MPGGNHFFGELCRAEIVSAGRPHPAPPTVATTLMMMDDNNNYDSESDNDFFFFFFFFFFLCRAEIIFLGSCAGRKS